jgi:hypothetical protein
MPCVCQLLTHSALPTSPFLPIPNQHAAWIAHAWSCLPTCHSVSHGLMALPSTDPSFACDTVTYPPCRFANIQHTCGASSVSVHSHSIHPLLVPATSIRRAAMASPVRPVLPSPPPYAGGRGAAPTDVLPGHPGCSQQRPSPLHLLSSPSSGVHAASLDCSSITSSFANFPPMYCHEAIHQHLSANTCN